MRQYRILMLAVLLAGTVTAYSQNAFIYSDAGNIFIERGGAKKKLTTSEMDVDPILSPNGAFVVYTRQGRGRTLHDYDTNQSARPSRGRMSCAGSMPTAATIGCS